MRRAETPPDEAARNRVRTELDVTLFVEAGAGSGKTSALVDRVVALVASGVAPIGAVAAITFTEKAAAELRDRIRARLAERAAEDTAEAARCASALEGLDGAAIGTLHAFAQRILAEHPIEAGLPPRIEVLDDVAAGVAFEARWSAFQDELLADPAYERSLQVLLASGVRPDALRALARVFEDNWDLVEERVPSSRPEPPPVRGRFAAVAADVRALCATPSSDPADKLRLRLDAIADHLARLEAIEDDLELLEALDPGAEPKAPSFKVGNVGKAGAFADVAGVRQAVADAGVRLAAIRSETAEAAVEQVACAVRSFSLAAAHERRRAGELGFHDLLVLARSLLRHPEHGPAVRARLHRRYRHLLLDEFQDTDPIQVELAVRIAADDPEGDDAGRRAWDEVAVTPGQLFFVGDPKQSIYRFRRADVATFLAAARHFGAERGNLVELTANFRTVAPIVAFVNHTFAALFAEPDDVVLSAPSQPDYVALEATRPAPTTGPALAVLGRHAHPADTPAAELRRAEALEVAGAVGRILAEGWTVDDGGAWRPACLGDVAVLVPTRTSLAHLEDALGNADIPFRTEARSLVYASREVRDLLMVLRALDDPTDELALVSALRTPLLACGDDDLFRFRHEHRGRWSYLADPPASLPAGDPVREALAYLSALGDQRSFLSPSELLAAVVSDRRLLELGVAEGRPRDLWRRVRFVVDQARAFVDATGGNLRQYLAWVDRQAADDARVSEAVLPESDDDAVRILTVHAAKGLEFPIVIVSGATGTPGGRASPVSAVFPHDGGVGYRLGGGVTTAAFAAHAVDAAQMELHERMRLGYVACTRARDHLVVSLHRKARSRPPEAARRTNAELLVEGMGDLLDDLDDAGSAPVRSRPPIGPPDPPAPFAEWQAARDEAIELAGRTRTVAATGLLVVGGAADVEPAVRDPGLDKAPRDLDLPPWLKGRYGTAVGRAVHGVLQGVDLSAATAPAGLVRAQCAAEGVAERASEVADLVRAALASPSVRDAALAEHWREVYVCTPVGDRLLEGYVDLCYRTPDGLVVVDYKTAATADPAELDRRVAAYAAQGAAYALALAAATGEAVRRATFVFLTPEGAHERHLGDLDAAVARLSRQVAERAGPLRP